MSEDSGRLARPDTSGRRSILRAAAVLFAGVVAGCATARPSAPAQAPTAASLEDHVDTIRARSATARPAPSGGFAPTIETQDARLAAALAFEATAATAASHRQVATEYERLGVLDLAYEHLKLAIEADPRDAAAYDARARLWRRWGFPRLGLPDAYKAAELAPKSPAAANTVGTLLTAAGQFQAARKWFARASALDPGASYAMNNLCYADLLSGRTSAVAECEQAVALTPASRVARNNLGLAYAAAGRMEQARAEFGSAGAEADASYNLGVAYMATGRFDRAAKAFAAARAARPQFSLAAARERQAQAAEAGAGATR